MFVFVGGLVLLRIAVYLFVTCLIVALVFIVWYLVRRFEFVVYSVVNCFCWLFLVVLWIDDFGCVVFELFSSIYYFNSVGWCMLFVVCFLLLKVFGFE